MKRGIIHAQQNADREVAMSWATCKSTTDEIIVVYRTAKTKKEAKVKMQTVRKRFARTYHAYLKKLEYSHSVYNDRLYISEVWKDCVRMAEADLETLRDYFLRVTK